MAALVWLPDLDALPSGGLQVLLRIAYGLEVGLEPFKTVEDAFGGGFNSGFGEPSDAVPAVGGGNDLDVRVYRSTEDHAPEARMNGVVDAVFGFVNQ